MINYVKQFEGKANYEVMYGALMLRRAKDEGHAGMLPGAPSKGHSPGSSTMRHRVFKEVSCNPGAKAEILAPLAGITPEYFHRVAFGLCKDGRLYREKHGHHYLYFPVKEAA